jgi:transcriptional regulator with GAF, ATPase, and Fis domain
MQADRTALLPLERVQFARFRLCVIAGPDAPQCFESTRPEATIGSGPGQDLRLTDPYVSRQHCVIRVCDDGLICEDLDSTNGTFVADHRVMGAVIAPGDIIAVGKTVVMVERPGNDASDALSQDDHFGRVLGRSDAMRRVFGVLERVVNTDVTILIEGETGTGKSALAEAIHQRGGRADKPFVVADCGAMSRHLLESELFGHERGAFTGATQTRIGLFESAAGGTVLLDDIAELPIDLQPKLLRVLERRTIRRVGASCELPVDVRLVAATNHDLRRAVDQRAFRSDLWYRINTIRVVMPPLRARRDDIPMLVTHFYRELLGDPSAKPPADLVRSMTCGEWRGNVRELRSAVERSLVRAPANHGASPLLEPAHVSFRVAKNLAAADWERRYLSELLPAHDGNVSRAARAAKMNRSHLSELVRRHGLSSAAENHSDEVRHSDD